MDSATGKVNWKLSMINLKLGLNINRKPLVDKQINEPILPVVHEAVDETERYQT